MADTIIIELSRADAEHFASLNDNLMTEPARRLVETCRLGLRRDAEAHGISHAIGEPCDICNGTGTDYIGRPCRRLVR